MLIILDTNNVYTLDLNTMHIFSLVKHIQTQRDFEKENFSLRWNDKQKKEQILTKSIPKPVTLNLIQQTG